MTTPRDAYELSIADSYAGLRRIGYTGIGAMKALRMLGVSLADAKAAHDRHQAADVQSSAGTEGQ